MSITFSSTIRQHITLFCRMDLVAVVVVPAGTVLLPNYTQHKSSPPLSAIHETTTKAVTVRRRAFFLIYNFLFIEHEQKQNWMGQGKATNKQPSYWESANLSWIRINWTTDFCVFGFVGWWGSDWVSETIESHMFSFRIYATILGLFCSLEGRRTQSKGINFGYVCMWLADDNRMMAGWHAWVTVGG